MSTYKELAMAFLDEKGIKYEDRDEQILTIRATPHNRLIKGLV